MCGERFPELEAGASGAAATGTSTGAAPDTGVLTLDFGFVQFAGFTLGKAISIFQTPWGSSGANSPERSRSPRMTPATWAAVC